MGPWKGRKADLIEKVELDGGEVAVSKERLGVLADEGKVDAGEEVVGAVAAANGGDEGGVGVGKGGVEVGEAMTGSSGEEQRSALKGVWSEARLEAELAEAVEAFLDPFLVGIGGGREDGDSGAGGWRGWAQEGNG
jgi:hypothetical protein